jgi:hypothetical protein
MDDDALARIDAAYAELLAAGLVVEAGRVCNLYPGVSRPMYVLSPAGVELKRTGDPCRLTIPRLRLPARPVILRGTR